MLDIGWSELLVIAVVMIVVVGPKDLPKMLRAFGKATGKLRATANEFRTHFDEAMREAELDEVKKTIDGVKQYDPRKTVTDIFEPVRSAGDDLRASLNNASPKPEETPAVPMDSPLDLSEIKEEEAKTATPAAQPVAAKPSAAVAEPAAEPVKKAAKPRASKAAADTAAKPAAKKAPAKSDSAVKAAPVKQAAEKKAAAPRTKAAAKTTKKTGTEQ
ncbi:sec-independent protein translocase protein TatB [Pseudochrobactrum saccharolyticum]|uniref:Sec-independent protein translocase protein TatB n=1 Tax=Pseudochrobactrum saccharolyticum TaxID=354352 RepID=A0A7W8EN82_9HYPH|nr:Sec-independent protein translocase protein TatB [Pseudochrobactrum saccharolyticum]KAB0538827.1 twin-arginine translocase subunit TatB [Pseudochrobactrum saccharolyticum]MBB5091200.1 sec-independent protein translocase protein TatB [Pseudochrobactrum saccharolyticum]